MRSIYDIVKRSLSVPKVEMLEDEPDAAASAEPGIVIASLSRTMARKEREINLSQGHISSCLASIEELRASIASAEEDVRLDQIDLDKIKQAIEILGAS